MAGWSHHRGRAVALPLEGIDTDQLIPARFMSAPRADGYGRFLLHDLRFDTDGAPRPGCPLARHPDASILVVRRNFGGGSSREAAVYALQDFGIRAVIGSSFGDIFAGNAVNNGLLPARVSEGDAAALLDALGDGAADAAIDLAQGTVVLAGMRITFALDPVWLTKLINGWDDIDLTASLTDEIRAFRDHDASARPWATPGAREEAT